MVDEQLLQGWPVAQDLVSCLELRAHAACAGTIRMLEESVLQGLNKVEQPVAVNFLGNGKQGKNGLIIELGFQLVRTTYKATPSQIDQVRARWC